MAVVKEKGKCWWGCRETGTLIHTLTPGGNVKWCNSCFWKTLAVPQKIKQKITTWPINCTFSFMQKENVNIRPQKMLFKNVSSSIVHNSQKMETTQMSNNSQMNKQNVVFTHGLLRGNKKEWKTIRCHKNKKQTCRNKFPAYKYL